MMECQLGYNGKTIMTECNLLQPSIFYPTNAQHDGQRPLNSFKSRYQIHKALGYFLQWPLDPPIIPIFFKFAYLASVCMFYISSFQLCHLHLYKTPSITMTIIYVDTCPCK